LTSQYGDVVPILLGSPGNEVIPVIGSGMFGRMQLTVDPRQRRGDGRVPGSVSA
jgi:hypothetical protein